MKSTSYILMAAMIGLVSIAATAENEDKIKVTVVKHQGNETTILDTTFAESSGYTVEQFLKDNDLSPEETEIIDTDAFDGKYTWQRANSFLFISGDESEFELNSDPKKIIVETIFETDDNEVQEIIEEIREQEIIQEVIVINSENEEGERKVTTTTIVNGEKTTTEETIPNDQFIIMGDDKGETSEKVRDILKKLEVEMEGVEFDVKELENLMNDVRVEFIEFEDVMKDAEIDFEELEKQIKTEMKVIVNGESIDIESEDSNNSFQYIINESSDNPQSVTVITSGNGISENEVVFEEIDQLRNLEYTVAIVTRIDSKEDDSDLDNEEVFIADPAILPIEGPFYYPNPTQGQFRLEFFLPERGQTQVQIFDVQGRMVYEDNLGDFQGAFNQEIDLSNLESGTYVMNIMQNNLRLAEKIIVN